MTLLATTELEAVNMMLAAIQEAPVATLDDDTIEDAQIALATLRQVSKEIQGRGWHFNKDYDYPLTVNGDNKIPIPVTAIHCDPMDDTYRDLVARGGFMYDRENRTYTFTDITSIRCVVVWALDWNELPDPMRTVIAMRAAKRFSNNMMGDEATYQFTDEDYKMAWAAAVADDSRRADRNILRNSRAAGNVVRRRRTWQG